MGLRDGIKQTMWKNTKFQQMPETMAYMQLHIQSEKMPVTLTKRISLCFSICAIRLLSHFQHTTCNEQQIEKHPKQQAKSASFILYT